MDYYIKDLSFYFPPVNLLSIQKRAMRHGINKTCSLKVRLYAGRLIDLYQYLASFPGATLSDKIDVTEFNEIILNIIHNSRSKQSYFRVFDCKSISFKNAVNIFELMVIAESIYNDVVEPSFPLVLEPRYTGVTAT